MTALSVHEISTLAVCEGTGVTDQVFGVAAVAALLAAWGAFVWASFGDGCLGEELG